MDWGGSDNRFERMPTTNLRFDVAMSLRDER